MADISATGYRDFVCVEAVNAYIDFAELNPGESHCISTTISLV